MSDIDLSALKNPRLLDFICGLALSQEQPARNYLKITGYDSLEFDVAIQTALQFGFVVSEMTPCGYAVSPAGLIWATIQLHPARAILAQRDAAKPDVLGGIA